MIQDIYLIDDDNYLTKQLISAFRNDINFRITSFNCKDLETALKNIPSIIIINEDHISKTANECCKIINQDEDNSITPIIVISSNPNHRHRLEIFKLSVLEYIKSPIEGKFLYYTIKNILDLLYVNRRISPLTGLPGNVQIHSELKKRLTKEEEFSVLYLDLDNFKAYNDAYGFMKGDEIIKFTAKTILKSIHDNAMEDSFVGHIGGDDFVAIVSADSNVDKICQDIIVDFDSNVLKFFSDEDLDKGFIEIPNRKGIIEEFPLTSLSIGVVVVDKTRFSNVLEIGEAGAGVKHLAKTIPGSTYVVDRRKK